MRWPQLVPPSVCKTAVKITLEGEMGFNGEPSVLETLDTFCNFSEKTFTKITADRQIISLSAAAFLSGDIFAGEEISGTAEIFGKSRRIYSASRARNPDGTVNYTKLELI